MNEQCYAIGNSPRLIGVYTFANTSESEEIKDTNLVAKELLNEQQKEMPKLKLKINSKPTILLLNAGLLNRRGPFRHYVRLARAFAKHGFNTFRFDLSGIGDSEQRTDNRSHDLHALDDISDVMNFLELQHGDNEFIVMGICSGADDAHKAMVKYKNVVGAVSIDGYSYITPKYYLKLYGKHIFRLASWLKLMSKALPKLMNLLKLKKEESTLESFVFKSLLPEKSKTALDYQNFINRDVYLLSIFTGEWSCSYEQQLADSFSNIGFRENIQAVYLENAGHTFPLPDSQTELTDIIVSWLNRTFP